MARVADHDDLAALLVHLGDLDVHLGHQRAGGVEHLQAARRRPRSRTACETPWALKITVAPSGTSSSSSTNTAPLRAEVVDDVAVVHDFVAHVDRRAVLLERALDDGDRAIDAGAEAARIGEQDVHVSDLLRRLRAAASVRLSKLSTISSDRPDADRAVGDVERGLVPVPVVEQQEIDDDARA